MVSGSKPSDPFSVIRTTSFARTPATGEPTTSLPALTVRRAVPAFEIPDLVQVPAECPVRSRLFGREVPGEGEIAEWQ